MIDLKGTELYWQEQTKKGDNPCHYHNKWQDSYAFAIRTGSFKRSDFSGVKKIVDVGCGVGEYLMEIRKKAPKANFTGFDFPFNIALAQKRYPQASNVTFVPHPLPDKEVLDEISTADVVYTTTVYVHLSNDAREAFLRAASKMKKNSKVMLLEYIPNEVPSFQKGLEYKEVETPNLIIEKFAKAGFLLKELRHVNYVDSFIFFHLGKNAFTYYLTLMSDYFLQLFGLSRSKYKLLIFEKK